MQSIIRCVCACCFNTYINIDWNGSILLPKSSSKKTRWGKERQEESKPENKNWTSHSAQMPCQSICVYASFTNNRISALDPSVNGVVLLLSNHWIADCLVYDIDFVFKIFCLFFVEALITNECLTYCIFLFGDFIHFCWFERVGLSKQRGKLGTVWVDGCKKLGEKKWKTVLDIWIFVIMPSINAHTHTHIDCSSFAHPNRFFLYKSLEKRSNKRFLFRCSPFFGSEISHN